MSDNIERFNSDVTYLVPGLFTNGSATQVKPPAQVKVTHLLLAHCANAPLIHAFSPDLQGAFALSEANLLSLPLLPNETQAA